MGAQVYGHVTETMWKEIGFHIVRQEIVDVGAGDGWYSERLSQIGASVIAFDKERAPVGLSPAIVWVQGLFRDASFPVEDVAFCSFPVNTVSDNGLSVLLSRFKLVILLSLNEMGTSCGSPELYHMLWGREVLYTERIPRNTLTIYGAPLGWRRAPLIEEVAGMFSHVLDPFHVFDRDRIERVAPKDWEDIWAELRMT